MKNKDYNLYNINKIIETEIKSRLNIKKNCYKFVKNLYNNRFI